MKKSHSLVFYLIVSVILTASLPVFANSDIAIKVMPAYLMLLEGSPDVPVKFTPLNDTGIIRWGDYPSGNNSTCTGDAIAQQDCSHGRDATHNDDSDGAAGFSFTKISSAGANLAASASDWSCVKDNVTGLMWEKKTNDGSVHDNFKRYQWGGLTALGRDHHNREGTYYDDWNTLVNTANTGLGLCGYTDWRVPTLKELQSIVHKGKSGFIIDGAIDTVYFPNTSSGSYWSSSPYASDRDNAWSVSFSWGISDDSYRTNTNRVRLVR